MSEYTELVERAEFAATSAKNSAAQTKSDKDTVVSLYNEIKAIIDAGGGGGSCKFYECASVDDGEGTPEIPAVKAGIEVSGVTYMETCNGHYALEGELQTYATALWKNSDGMKVFKCSGYDYWVLTNSGGSDPGDSYFYAPFHEGTPPWEEEWTASMGSGTMKMTGSLVDIPAVPAVPGTGVKSWTGYEWVQTADEAGELLYQKSETLTEGLSWSSVKPKIGKSYSEDALMEIYKFYQGITVPQSGLVFACLMDNAETTATGDTITNNGGVFKEYDGIPSVYLDGNSSLNIDPNNIDSVMGSNPCTMSCWLYFPQEQPWRENAYYAFTYGNRQGDGENRCIGVLGDGTVKADTWSGTTGGNIIGSWHHVVAIFANNTVSLYIDDELISQGSCEMYTQSQWVYIGRTSSSDPHFIGYIGPCRIYNRVLEDYEITALYEEYAR